MADKIEAREFRTPAGRWYLTLATTDEANPAEQFLSEGQAKGIADSINRPIPMTASVESSNRPLIDDKIWRRVMVIPWNKDEALRRALLAADNLLSQLEAHQDMTQEHLEAEDQAVVDGAKADLLFARQFLPDAPFANPPTPLATADEMRLAHAIVDSDAVLRVYLATEWACLSSDAKEWLSVIIREAQRFTLIGRGARAMFDAGFIASWSEAFVKGGQKPPFDLTDAALDRAWDIHLATRERAHTADCASFRIASPGPCDCGYPAGGERG